MSDTNKTSGLQLRSLISTAGQLELSLARVDVPEPGPDQVVVRVEATPINPSDLGLLTGPADLSKATSSGSGEGVKVTAPVSAAALPFLATRLGESLPVGNEGAGTVIKAGSSDAALSPRRSFHLMAARRSPRANGRGAWAPPLGSC